MTDLAAIVFSWNNAAFASARNGSQHAARGIGMALVRHWTHTTGHRSSRTPTTSEGSWAIEEHTNNQVLLVLRTYGSNDRQDTGTVSQVLHLDASGAAALSKILESALPLLGDTKDGE